MPLRGLGQSAREAWEVPRDLLLGRYPAFVTGGPLERGLIPVFVFHGAEPVSFSRKLEHLARNGYRTLSVDEYLAVLRGASAPPERAVLLTFDDGRGSVWSVAAPLLKRHGMKTVVFLVPGRIPSRPPGPDWDDVAGGRAAASVVLEREQGESAPPERAVLLTFDDGRGSVWSVAAPLLKRHGMKTVVFLVPGRIPSRPPGPDWDDVAGGRAAASVVLEREQGESALLSWQEIERLAGGGLVEFQSHTLLHSRIHTGPAIAGFATPRTRAGYDAFDQPLVRDGERDLLGSDVALGTPLLRSEPRTSDALRFFEAPELRTAAVAAVADAGGAAFFERPDWERRLRALVAGISVHGRLETRDEQQAAVRHELAEARRVIAERTGRPVVHLCYPWHVAGRVARRLAAEAGYETAFCGKVRGVPITRPGGDPLAIARLGEDYVELLPGTGRGSLSELLRRKWTRRFAGPQA